MTLDEAEPAQLMGYSELDKQHWQCTQLFIDARHVIKNLCVHLTIQQAHVSSNLIFTKLQSLIRAIVYKLSQNPSLCANI